MNKEEAVKDYVDEELNSKQLEKVFSLASDMIDLINAHQKMGTTNPHHHFLALIKSISLIFEHIDVPKEHVASMMDEAKVMILGMIDEPTLQ